MGKNGKQQKNGGTPNDKKNSNGKPPGLVEEEIQYEPKNDPQLSDKDLLKKASIIAGQEGAQSLNQRLITAEVTPPSVTPRDTTAWVRPPTIDENGQVINIFTPMTLSVGENTQMQRRLEDDVADSDTIVKSTDPKFVIIPEVDKDKIQATFNNQQTENHAIFDFPKFNRALDEAAGIDSDDISGAYTGAIPKQQELILHQKTMRELH
ncbi:unnamed protein product [Trichogramma brassicae]|uniref:Uncharacterized protein n=1 Tax=Trichogramma brassicae TaxID=86971 RepID=A0A6H5I051_9HYME|nr:unnamed protein product [Trichogramma brassicae]